MSALLVAVLLASLAGSLHCAGMCGPFCAIVAGGAEGSSFRRAAAHAAYGAGRLVTYALLGAAAGWLGGALDVAGGQLAGVQRLAAIVAGVTIVGGGVLTLLAHFGLRWPGSRLGARVGARVSRLMAPLMRLPGITRAAAIGLFSVLLPCGWLWAFAITAAGTGSPLRGALVMGVFWAGTMPVMLGLGAAMSLVAAPLRRHAPALTALALVVVGLVAIAGRMPAIGASLADEGTSVPASIEEAEARLAGVAEKTPSCCAAKERANEKAREEEGDDGAAR